jgi:hypothetical protein
MSHQPVSTLSVDHINSKHFEMPKRSWAGTFGDFGLPGDDPVRAAVGGANNFSGFGDSRYRCGVLWADLFASCLASSKLELW